MAVKIRTLQYRGKDYIPLGKNRNEGGLYINRSMAKVCRRYALNLARVGEISFNLVLFWVFSGYVVSMQ